MPHAFPESGGPTASATVFGAELSGSLRPVNATKRLQLRAAVFGALVAAILFTMGAGARGSESLADLREQMVRMQHQLDSSTRRIEQLRTQEHNLRVRLADINVRLADLNGRQDRLKERAAAAAKEMYKNSGMAMLELLVTSSNLGELSARVEVMSRVAQGMS
jgi:TolA-binding protein